MKKIRITTPENIEVEYTLADLGSRTAAALIDMAIQGITIMLIAIAAFLILNFSETFLDEYYGWIIGISIIIYGLVSYGYFIVMELTMNGRTIGKKIMKLRTIRSNGQPITLKHSAIRNLFRVFIDIFGIGAVLIFFTKDKKRLGDMAASTIVVIEENKATPITLESLQNINESFSYYISDEEYELLRDYLGRRDTMEDCTELREELKLHFKEKFQELGILNEWENFIDKL